MNNLMRLGFTEADIADGGSDRLLEALVAYGRVDDIAAKAQAHRDAGADHVLVQVMNGRLGDPPVDEWRELAPALCAP